MGIMRMGEALDIYIAPKTPFPVSPGGKELPTLVPHGIYWEFSPSPRIPGDYIVKLGIRGMFQLNERLIPISQFT